MTACSNLGWAWFRTTQPPATHTYHLSWFMPLATTAQLITILSFPPGLQSPDPFISWRIGPSMTLRKESPLVIYCDLIYFGQWLRWVGMWSIHGWLNVRSFLRRVFCANLNNNNKTPKKSLCPFSALDAKEIAGTAAAILRLKGNKRRCRSQYSHESERKTDRPCILDSTTGLLL